jgi:hypothetical protein
MVATTKGNRRLNRRPAVAPIPLWLRTVLLAACSIGLASVLVFGPTHLPQYKVKLIGIVPALLCGFAAFFTIGRLTVGVSRTIGKSISFSLRGTGGLGFAVLFLLLWFNYAPAADPPSSYHINLRVVDEHGLTAETAKVETSVPSIISKGDNLWRIDIPETAKSKGERVNIYAAVPLDYLKGETSVILQDERDQSATLTLKKDRSAHAIGRVVDTKGLPVADALVYVVGHEDEAIRTGSQGQFDAPAYVGPSEWIRIHAEKVGYMAEEMVAHAGDESTQIPLRKR